MNLLKPKGNSSIEMSLIFNRMKINLVIIIVFLIALSVSGQSFLREIRYYQMIGGQDDLSRLEERFNKVKELLPEKGIIGYYSDIKHDAKTFRVAGYSLSPRIVTPGLNYPFVIGNFSQYIDPVKFAKANHFSILRRIDHRILLLKKRGP